MKTCSKCKTAVSLEFFSRDKSRADGYCDRCKPCRLIAHREWREKNPDKAYRPDRASRYYLANKEAYAARAKNYAERNPGESARRFKAAIARHPTMRAKMNHDWRARRGNAGGSHTVTETLNLLTAQGYCCAVCEADLRIVRKALDHFVPLSKGGTNNIENLQWLCFSCNGSKHANDPYEWLQRKGKLSLLRGTYAA